MSTALNDVMLVLHVCAYFLVKLSEIVIVLTGTLTRCIDSLEQQDKENQVINGSVSKEGNAATSALRQILNAAYQINIQINPGNTVLRHLVDKMKQVMVRLKLATAHFCMLMRLLLNIVWPFNISVIMHQGSPK